jgi:uncharacterized glyoxalase superfamily protein PhnB
MTNNDPAATPGTPNIAPWLSVPDGPRAVDHYQAAFGAVERYRLADPFGHHWEVGKPLADDPG